MGVWHSLWCWDVLFAVAHHFYYNSTKTFRTIVLHNWHHILGKKKKTNWKSELKITHKSTNCKKEGCTQAMGKVSEISQCLFAATSTSGSFCTLKSLPNPRPTQPALTGALHTSSDQGVIRWAASSRCLLCWNQLLQHQQHTNQAERWIVSGAAYSV